MKKFIYKNKIILLISVLLLVYMSYILIRQEMKYQELLTDRDEYTNQIDELKVTISELNDMINEISTPAYIEKMAREKLQMVKPDEIIYILED